jgi:hypothetical protein
MAMAVTFAGERRTAEAVSQLETAYAQRDPRLASAAVEPLFRELYVQKSFIALLEKMKLR